MKKRFYICLLLALGVSGLMSGCGKDFGERTEINSHSEESRAEEEVVKEETVNGKESRDQNATRITPTSEVRELETGLSIVRYEGEYGFGAGFCLPVCTVGWHE